MKKIILLCTFGALLLTGCTQTTPVSTQEPETTTPEVQTNKTAEPSIEKPALTKINEKDYLVYYKGNITVKGEYSEYKPDSILGEKLCFNADKETGDLIPRDTGDNRAPWFCFENRQEAKSMFGINDSEIFKDPKVECLKGKAEIEISNYIVNTREAAVQDSAKLEKVITKEPFSTNCKLTD